MGVPGASERSSKQPAARACDQMSVLTDNQSRQLQNKGKRCCGVSRSASRGAGADKHGPAVVRLDILPLHTALVSLSNVLNLHLGHSYCPPAIPSFWPTYLLCLLGRTVKEPVANTPSLHITTSAVKVLHMLLNAPGARPAAAHLRFQQTRQDEGAARPHVAAQPGLQIQQGRLENVRYQNIKRGCLCGRCGQRVGVSEKRLCEEGGAAVGAAVQLSICLAGVHRQGIDVNGHLH